jgi:hypothetical protein
MRYEMSGKWWPERLPISDDAGTARFEVRNVSRLATMLSLSVAGGEEVATIKRRRRGGFRVVVRGQEAGLVKRRADRYDIQRANWPPAGGGRPLAGGGRASAGGRRPLAAVGSVRDGKYSITRDGLVLATVSRQGTADVRPVQTITVDVGDGDAVALLAVILALEALRYERAGSQFNPGGLREHAEYWVTQLLNPVNWLGG